jgi:hypothetical protein
LGYGSPSTFFTLIYTAPAVLPMVMVIAETIILVIGNVIWTISPCKAGSIYNPIEKLS